MAAPEEIVVNEGESIQAAIDAAPVNSVIRIMPGKYCEQLKINKPLKLIGSGDRTIIQCSGTSTCVKITKGTISVVLANLCIDGAGSYKSTGVFIEQSHHNQLLNLTIRNFYKGLRIYDSMDNFLRNVNLLNNTYNFEVYGLYLSHFIHDIDISNTVNGRKIYYLVNVRNTVLRGGDVGYVAIINSTDVLVTNLLLSENFSGLLLAYTNNTTICNVTCTKNIQGIRLVNSHNITISENSFLQNEWSGISFEPATTCKIYSNIFKFNQHAIYLSHAPYILKVRTTGNKVFLNKIINNTVGLYVNGACSNEIFNNDFIRNEIAVEIDNASGNKFYGNNFLENRKDVNFVNPLSFNVTNFWDRGYPAAGNYWSKYNYVDEYEGPFQNVSGSDGVIDNPFLIEIEYSNIDRYPLLRPIATFRGIQSDSEGLFEISGNFSEILDFNFNPDHLCVIFKFVANSSNIFCRIGIPHSLFLAENDDWRVFLNGSCVEYKIYKGIDHTILYFKTPAMGNCGFHVWDAK
ncbi:MAG: NosD domain-containing protein, partial [Candidatus Bathyarchaeia archaeon]